MYQAIARFCYLTEVRQKALEMYTDEKTFDSNKALLLIQAVKLKTFFIF